MSCWNSKTCNQIKGTDGTMFPPFISKETVLEAFVPFLNRSIHFNYESESHIHGLKTLKFQLPTDLFHNSKSKDHISCYCVNKDTCTVDGVYDLSKCNNGVPLLISMPHFLDADSNLQNSVL
ncbi:lysosome membrane protein 2-like protein, partial [Leptotrombidium deliense]